MPFNPDWLIPDERGTPVDRWLGQLKALQTEAVRVINRLRVGALEDGTGLTAGQRTALYNWYDGWRARIQQHLNTAPS